MSQDPEKIIMGTPAQINGFTEDMTCARCRWSIGFVEKDMADFRGCLARPPTPIVLDKEVWYIQPRVKAEGACGEWTPDFKGEPKPTPGRRLDLDP